jgi:hypothetical protein
VFRYRFFRSRPQQIGIDSLKRSNGFDPARLRRRDRRLGKCLRTSPASWLRQHWSHRTVADGARDKHRSSYLGGNPDHLWTTMDNPARDTRRERRLGVDERGHERIPRQGRDAGGRTDGRRPLASVDSAADIWTYDGPVLRLRHEVGPVQSRAETGLRSCARA